MIKTVFRQYLGGGGGGGGGKNVPKIDYVICERPLGEKQTSGPSMTEIVMGANLTADTRKIFVSRPSTSPTRRASWSLVGCKLIVIII